MPSQAVWYELCLFLDHFLSLNYELTFIFCDIRTSLNKGTGEQSNYFISMGSTGSMGD